MYRGIGETSLADEVAKSTNSINGYLTDIKDMLGDFMDGVDGSESGHSGDDEDGTGLRPRLDSERRMTKRATMAQK